MLSPLVRASMGLGSSAALASPLAYSMRVVWRVLSKSRTPFSKAAR